MENKQNLIYFAYSEHIIGFAPVSEMLGNYNLKYLEHTSHCSDSETTGTQNIPFQLSNDLCLDSWKCLSVLYFFLKQAGQLHVIALGEMFSTFLIFLVCSNDLLNYPGGLPCKLEGILESPIVDEYRNKCEFSVGYSLEGKKTVGFMLGNFRLAYLFLIFFTALNPVIMTGTT